MNKILITGASGSVGSALARKLINEKLYLFDQDESGLFDIYEELKNKGKVEYIIGSIRDKEKLDLVFSKYRPEIVYFASAYKHVILMEKWPDEAIKTNIEGLENTIEVAKKYKVKKFVFVSSDKAVNPTSMMGRTKKWGEQLCLKANGKTKFIIVRFGNVMASRGSLLEIWKKQIEENKPLTITHPKMKRYFMGLYEAVDLILKASHMGEDGEIFVLNSMDEIYIRNLAKLMIKLSGKDISIVYTKPGKGEKMKEILMTASEKRRSVYKNGMWIIKNEKNKKSNKIKN